MRNILSILSSALAAFLLISYLIGVMFGSGLHVHGSLSHDHEDRHRHTHAFATHVHDTEIVPHPDSHGESLIEIEHLHSVHVLHLIAVTVSNITTTKQHRETTVCTVVLPPVLSYYSSVSILFISPPEPLPPIRFISHSGLSPPSA
jgi:hypothetical protein